MAKKPKKVKVISPETQSRIQKLWIGGERGNAIEAAAAAGVDLEAWRISKYDFSTPLKTLP